MRFVSIAARRVLRGSWAWITLKPGSRPHRTARKLLEAALSFALARPRLARIVGPLLPRLPLGDARSERERFVHAELMAALEKRPS